MNLILKVEKETLFTEEKNKKSDGRTIDVPMTSEIREEDTIEAYGMEEEKDDILEIEIIMDTWIGTILQEKGTDIRFKTITI